MTLEYNDLSSATLIQVVEVLYGILYQNLGREEFELRWDQLSGENSVSLQVLYRYAQEYLRHPERHKVTTICGFWQSPDLRFRMIQGVLTAELAHLRTYLGSSELPIGTRISSDPR